MRLQGGHKTESGRHFSFNERLQGISNRSELSRVGQVDWNHDIVDISSHGWKLTGVGPLQKLSRMSSGAVYSQLANLPLVYLWASLRNACPSPDHSAR